MVQIRNCLITKIVVPLQGIWQRSDVWPLTISMMAIRPGGRSNDERPRKNFDGGDNRPRFRSNDSRPDQGAGRSGADGEPVFRTDRPGFSKDNDRGSDRGGRSGGSDRPSFGSDRPRYNSDRPSGDRPPFRKFDGDRPSGGDRPRFGGGDRPSGDRPPFRKFDGDRPGGDRPFRGFNGDRPDFKDDRGDRPAFRSFDRSENNNDGDRPRRRDMGITRSDVRQRIQKLRSGKTTRDSFGTNVGQIREMPDYSEKLSKMELKHAAREAKQAGVEVSTDKSVRLNKFIANAGICSRRDADQLIANGQIMVNGIVVTEMGHKVEPHNVVTYGGKELKPEGQVYILLNKPKDYITTTEDPENRHTVMELIRGASKGRVFPVGRLDRNTTGLLVLTNDGDLAEKMTHPSFETRKIYQVDLDKPIAPEDFEKVKAGVMLEDGLAEVDEVEILSPDQDILGLAIHSGRNRIVRRIFEELGYDVIRLDRVMYASLTKKDLPRGHWRYLSEQEVIRLKYFTK